MFRSQLLSFAEFERDAIAERMLSGQLGTAAQGKWATGRWPTGYKVEEGKIVVDEEKAPAVRRILELRPRA